MSRIIIRQGGEDVEDRILLKNVPGEGADPFVSCECCCRVSEVLESGDLRMPTGTELLRSFGRTCGRCGENTLGESAVWPTLPCEGAGSFSVLLGADVFNPPGPKARFLRQRACLRFLARIVDYEKVVSGPVIDEAELGGNAARSLTSAVEEAFPYRADIPDLFTGEHCGLYIYVVEFYQWISRCTCWDIVIGGAEPQGCDEDAPHEEPCIKLRVYNQDMFRVARAGPFFSWPPYFENDCTPVLPATSPP
jgi:hypothetical protein